jgi:hypothetical protein
MTERNLAGVRPWHIIELAIAETVEPYRRLADSAAAAMEQWLVETGGPESHEDWSYLDRICHAELWRMSQGDTTRTRRRLAELRSRYAEAPRTNWYNCPLVLEALLADGTDEARESLQRLEEFMLQGPGGTFRTIANLIIARLHARRGDPQAALAASRRVQHQSVFPLVLRPAYLREECLAALALHDRDARGACTHYLTIRPERPDNEVLAREWDQVRDALAVLAGEAR